MTYQLRMYAVRPGAYGSVAGEWRDKVVPLRKKFGFDVVSARVTKDGDQFIWIVGYGGPRRGNKSVASTTNPRSDPRWTPTQLATWPRRKRA